MNALIDAEIGVDDGSIYPGGAARNTLSAESRLLQSGNLGALCPRSPGTGAKTSQLQDAVHECARRQPQHTPGKADNGGGAKPFEVLMASPPRPSTTPSRSDHGALQLLGCLAAALLLVACGGSGGSGGSGGNGGPQSANESDGPPTTSFSGTVTFNGAPVSGATVIAFNTNSNSTFATTTTDANGKYSFSGFGTACTDSCVPNFQLWALKAGYAFYPVLSGSPSGSQAGYQWDSAASDWYVASGAAICEPATTASSPTRRRRWPHLHDLRLSTRFRAQR